MPSCSELAGLLSSEFSKAEKAVKDYEHLTGELPFPSVNELRYAGCHAVQAIKLGLGENEKCIELLDRAVRHSRRAFYDVLEFDVMLMTQKVEACKRAYEGYEYLAASVIPNYLDHVKRLNNLGEQLDVVHELDKDSREYVHLCRNQIQVMRNFVKDFLAAEEALFAAIKHDQQRYRLSWVQCAVGIVGGFVLGILITVLFS